MDQGTNPEEDARQKSEAARRLGQSRSERKAASSRENAKKGGRPKGFSPSEESRRKMSETMRRRAATRRDANAD